MNEQTQIIKSLTREERELLCFSRPVGYHTRLQQYWESPETFEEGTRLPESALCLSATKTFRHYLRRFIRTFRPEVLLPNKRLWLHLEKNGRFSVRLGKGGAAITDLSETEHYVFQYLCFLHLRRFWNGLRKRSRFPAVTGPVLIRDFSARLDETVDYDALLRRASEVSTRVIVQ